MDRSEPRVRVSVDGIIQNVGEPIEVTLSFHSSATRDDAEADAVRVDRLEGELILDAVKEDESIERSFRSTPVSYTGAPVDRFTMHLPPEDAPGLFILRFRGTPESEGDARFAITEA